MTNPYGIVYRCVLRRSTLPALPCDCRKCDWFIHDTELKNCFWVLAHMISESKQQMSFEDIAEIEGISVEEAKEAYTSAIKKWRMSTRHEEDNEID